MVNAEKDRQKKLFAKITISTS